MTRLVVDTNVFVAAAFNSSSSSAGILRGIERGRFTLIWNEATRRETEAVVGRIPRIDWDQFKHLFRPECENIVATDPDAFAEVEDPDDRKFAALAAVSEAILVTNDRHLLDQALTNRLDVMKPRDFLSRRA